MNMNSSHFVWMYILVVGPIVLMLALWTYTNTHRG